MPEPTRTNNHPASRTAAQTMLSLLIAVSFLGCHQSEPIPAEIVGDSMAPRLCGKSFRQMCPACAYEFKSSATNFPATVLCPNCTAKFPTATKKQLPDAVTVIPRRAPKRWEIIAFQQDNNTLIKRVVAMPGETVDLSNGDLKINQKVMPKPESVQADLSRHVFDSNFIRQSSSPLQANFHHWQQTEQHWSHSHHSSNAIDWIDYRHPTQHWAQPSTESKWPTIDDSDGYNQNVSQVLHAVDDLIVETELSLTTDCKFFLQRTVGDTTYEVSLKLSLQQPHLEGTFTSGDDEQTFSTQLNELANRHSFLLSVANLDGIITLKIDGKTLLETLQKTSSRSPLDREMDRPLLRIGFSGNSRGSINRLQIWRDIYYNAQAGQPKFRLPVTLGQGEYFVLGDNVPVSRDSRHFGAVKKIIGVVTKQPTH